MPVRDLSSSNALIKSEQLSIHRSNAFTAARGELSGKYFIAKSLRFTFFKLGIRD